MADVKSKHPQLDKKTASKPNNADYPCTHFLLELSSIIEICLQSSPFMSYNSLQSCYLSTSSNSTLIILFSKMLKMLKIISSKSKNIMKESCEHLGIFHLLKLNFSKLINYSTDMCVGMAKVLRPY